MAELVLALDMERRADAERLLDQAPDLRWVKVGSILFAREGPAFVTALRARGLEVFLDLKWHDIPNTVAGAVRAARELDVRMATVHALGGAAMCAAAAEAGGPDLGIVAVTVLTSHDATSYAAAAGRHVDALDLVAETGRLASLATAAGTRGVVCSPHEVAVLRERLGPTAWIVVPGIRRAGDAVGDQQRTADPAAAVRAGATHLVVGRPILQAAEPAAEVRRFLEALAA
jgi:orotidine-5'-phosphate decarboxylase